MSKYTKFWSLISFLGSKINLDHFDWCVILERYSGHILPAVLYHARARTGWRAHDSKCLNEVYISYIINNILCKKFLDKPNRVKPWGAIFPPPPRPDVNLRARPDRVKGNRH